MHLQRRKRVEETRGEASETNANEDNEKRDAWCKRWCAAQLQGGAGRGSMNM